MARILSSLRELLLLHSRVSVSHSRFPCYSSSYCIDHIIFCHLSIRSVIGPRNHFDKDKADIKNRAQTAQEDVSKRHTAEKATLAFSRIMILHKSSPSSEEESIIDQKMKDLVELVSSSFGSAPFAALNASDKGTEKLFGLALEAIRRVHVRRTVAKVSGTNDAVNQTNDTYSDNYKLLLDLLPKAHWRRPFVKLDQLNAILAAQFQVRKNKPGEAKSITRMDNEALQLAKDFLEVVKASAGRKDDNESSLFAASNQSLNNELFDKTKHHFSKAVSLYHSLEAHEMCAQWSELLQSIIQLNNKAGIPLEDTDVLLGQVMTVKAYAQTMSGNQATGVSRIIYCLVADTCCQLLLSYSHPLLLYNR